MMAIVSSMLVERTERGDAMFLTMLDRHTSHVLDTGALEILPAAAQLQALQPNPADEAAHTPGDEPLWNESWYWDWADPEQESAAGSGWDSSPIRASPGSTRWCAGRGFPPSHYWTSTRPCPTTRNTVRSGEIEMRHGTTEPLQTYRVEVSGPASAYDDPAGLLHEQQGRPVDLSMALTWTRRATLRLPDHHPLRDSLHGQRIGEGRRQGVSVRRRSRPARPLPWRAGLVEHGLGLGALHLEDGTHLHGVDLHPEPATGQCRLCPAAGRTGDRNHLGDCRRHVRRERVAAGHCFDHGARAGAGGHRRARSGAGAAGIADGRISFFPRAWATVETDDGRRGVGWLEWNRNQR